MSQNNVQITKLYSDFLFLMHSFKQRLDKLIQNLCSCDLCVHVSGRASLLVRSLFGI